MRHFLSLLLSLILASLVYVLVGYGENQLAEGFSTGSVEYLPASLGLGATLVAGALYAVLVLARLSPVGTVTAGLLFLGVSGWAIMANDSFLDITPNSILGEHGILDSPNPTSALIAVPLLATVLSPRRWRRHAGRPAPVPAAAMATTGPATSATEPVTSENPSSAEQPSTETQQPPTDSDTTSVSESFDELEATKVKTAG